MKKNPVLEHITFTVDIPLTYELLTDILSLITEGSIDYWGELCFEADDYAEAKKYITKQVEAGKLETAFGNSLCYEDVLAGILMMGKELNIWEREDDIDHYFDLKALCRGITSYFTNNFEVDFDFDIWGVCTGDGIAQFICFDEWVYG